MPTYKCGVFKDGCPMRKNKDAIWKECRWCLEQRANAIVRSDCPVNESVVRHSLIEVEEKPIVVEMVGKISQFENTQYDRFTGYKLDINTGCEFANATVSLRGKRVKITIEELSD